MKIGIIQQHNTGDVSDNRRRLTEKIQQLAGEGAQLIVLQELHDSLYFCQTEDVANFDLATAIPGDVTAHYAGVARQCGVVLVTSMFERRATGLYHNTAVVFDSDGSIAGKYRKMHDPRMTPPITKSSTSLRAISASSPSTPRWDALVCWCAGTSGFPKPPD